MFIVFSKNLLSPFAKVKKNVKDYFLVGFWRKVSGRQSFCGDSKIQSMKLSAEKFATQFKDFCRNDKQLSGAGGSLNYP